GARGVPANLAVLAVAAGLGAVLDPGAAVAAVNRRGAVGQPAGPLRAGEPGGGHHGRLGARAWVTRRLGPLRRAAGLLAPASTLTPPATLVPLSPLALPVARLAGPRCGLGTRPGTRGRTARGRPGRGGSRLAQGQRGWLRRFLDDRVLGDLDLQVEQAADGFLLDALHHGGEQVVPLALVLDQRVALSHCPQADAFPQVVHLVQVLAPLAVEDREDHAALKLAHDVGG